MIRADRILIVATALLVVALVVWGMTLGEYPASANVFPAIAAGGVVVFGVLALREPPPQEGTPLTLTAVLWLLAVLPLIYLLGFRIALPLYGLVYALARQTKPLPALALAIGIAAVVEILFVRVLGLHFDWGWLVAPLVR
ncbi:tripartite tricarboxylate transporter TctB family protein [Mangrovibrevibacter kandeliae]|uniref:tripartite tricarboxylate transporter TctB family protein n=1 Tax=Mangrovibrevibacter kandeliae TaxID=2968473 RepID=UPI00211934E5|nr:MULTISPECIES: tripartite tricarboxylate transporter TctB family protein [unclassified Aurantimonas]MCQ8783053.1 tripartite tricarboxylate transporter TctB family protein [Aurantimonas sp. CSK15Z-1]MCW4115757.1 tripartite tricarboxylate transporter TctB family protein [Aurantimonas sp. MSK8Z-1]